MYEKMIIILKTRQEMHVENWNKLLTKLRKEAAKRAKELGTDRLDVERDTQKWSKEMLAIKADIIREKAMEDECRNLRSALTKQYKKELKEKEE